MNNFPCVTIITAVYNSVKYLEATIESVKNQTYKNIEYIVIDGGSTDGTLDVIKRNEDFISYWVSRSDSSMYEAINDGIKKSRGLIIGNINSDDCFVNNEVVANIVSKFPDDADGVYCNLVNKYESDQTYRKIKLFQADYKSLLYSLHSTFVPHPTLFLKRTTYVSLGLFDLNYKFASDYDLVLRALQKYDIKYIDYYAVYFRQHSESITSSGRLNKERKEILRSHGIDRTSIIYRILSYAFLWAKYKIINILNRRSSKVPR